MYQLTQNFSTLAELQAAVAAMSGTPNATAGQNPVGGKPAKAAATSPSSPPAPSSSAGAPPAAPAVKEKAYADTPIGGLLKKAVETGKKDAALALLTKFNATKDGKPSGQGLKPEQFGDFETEIQKVIDGKIGLVDGKLVETSDDLS